MSQLKTNSITHVDNGGDPNIILYDDGSTNLTNTLTSSQNGGQLAGLRNQIINGAMVIAQRGSGPVTTTSLSGTYTCVDRFTVDDVTSSQRPVADLPGFSHTLRIINGGRYKVRQAIELNTPGYNCQFSVGSTWTASLWSTADITVGSLVLVFANDHTGGGFVEAAGSQSWTAIETIGRWTRYKATVTITGTAAGTNQCLLCEFTLAEGDFSGFQFEPGPVATPFEHRPIATELALCQRYYYKNDNDYTTTAKDAYHLIAPYQAFPVSMRSGPITVTVRASVSNTQNQIGEFNSGASPVYVTDRAVAIRRLSTEGYEIWSSTGQLTAGPAIYRWSFDADAEL